MKFITTEHDGIEQVHLFSNDIDHDVFFEGLRNKTHGNWRRHTRKAIAAGFVDSSWLCHGRSETLDLDSRSKDTDLLQEQF